MTKPIILRTADELMIANHEIAHGTNWPAQMFAAGPCDKGLSANGPLRPKSVVHGACGKIPRPVGRAPVRACSAARTILLVGLAALAAPVPALAQDASLTVDVNVAVAPSCSITAATPAIYLGELSTPGSALLSFSFSCNSSFQFVLSSRHGGLRHYTWQPVASPFVSLVPYTVSYSIGTSSGILAGACSSSSMVQGVSRCGGASSPAASAINQIVTLSFSWGLSGQYPVAGIYSDTLNLRMSAGL